MLGSMIGDDLGIDKTCRRGKTGGSSRVAGQNESFLIRLIELQVGPSRVDPYFSNKFFFFFFLITKTNQGQPV